MSDLEDLAAFALLMEAGSFTAAAERLGCSKGQLSKRISALERGLGSQLLHRTTRRLHLTAAGAALLPEAQALQAQAQRARQVVRGLQEEVSGTVRLTVPVSLGETFFDGLLLDFASRHPQVRVELDLANAYRDLLAEGFDLAIRSSQQPDERLVARPLFALQEITCAAPAYLARQPVPRTPAELAAHNCLLNTHYSGFEEWLYHRQHQLERVRVSGQLASNHYSLLKKAALSGAGVARLPSYMIQEELADGRLVWLLRDYQTRSTPVFLVHPWQGGLPRRTRALADYLLGWFERSRQALDGLR
ncbi:MULTISPECIES: LysR family transcriptional regulator [unclassified Pseudomonas]|uniref:LysR family transcriptional regulator n=1 Tax=unclassified Pseudomonas TaxID=196821 RepID=UPI002448D2A1|nr:MULTISPECIES: LysR family transcriptional regulator [unclassified Pseudomonas]MDH0896436.1 LysR family transcriptional regulator [Pseudomonas sp. GD03875]MDH1066833.1 LysR family transcriptional regulator [Pseudomonas sp. GD03985]